jgi:4-hydroxy-tetrahydrodipicolinate synthase
MRNPILGSLTALATPFRHTKVDWASLASLTERQIDRGTAALVACGSTGEAAALTQSEYSRAVHVVVEAARGRVPVIAGCTGSSTAATAALGVQAAAAGAEALLCAVPPYVKPTQDGIFAHIRAVAHATDLPIVLYDVPSRSCVAIADATVARLFEARCVIGFKDATGDVTRPPRLRALCGDGLMPNGLMPNGLMPNGLMQWSGDDATAPAYRAMGGHGCISVTANVAPALCAAMHAAWDAGDLTRFGELRDLLSPLHAALFAESNPIPLKAALSALGLCANEVRLPLTRATAATEEALRKALPAVRHAEEQAARRPALALAS